MTETYFVVDGNYIVMTATDLIIFTLVILTVGAVIGCIMTMAYRKLKCLQAREYYLNKISREEEEDAHADINRGIVK